MDGYTQCITQRQADAALICVEFEIPPVNSKDIITLSDINSIHTAIWHGESKIIKKVIIQLY